MRRSLSSVVLGLSLVLASIAWSGVVLTRTALDPGRSEDLADQMFENPEVRSALVTALANRLEDRLPEGVALPRQTVLAVADRALDDSAIQLLVRDGLVEVHQKALRGEDTNTTLHATAVGTAARNALVAERPELDPLLPEAPAMRVELPTAGLSVLGRIRAAVETASQLLGVAAAAGAILALLAARDRAMILRRVANWAFGTALIWLAIAIVVPRIISTLAPSQGVVAGAIATILFAEMIRPAMLLAGCGVALIVGSWLWGQGSRRRGSRLIGRPSYVS